MLIRRNQSARAGGPASGVARSLPATAAAPLECRALWPPKVNRRGIRTVESPPPANPFDHTFRESYPMQNLLATAVVSAFALIQAPAIAQEKKAEPAKTEPAKTEAKKAEPAKPEAKKDAAKAETKTADTKKEEQKKPKKGGC